MSKRKKYPFKNTYQTEWALKNYLTKHGIRPDDWESQTIIINSFYIERGGDNESDWKDKVLFTQEHFGLFAQYAQNNFKQKDI